MAQKPIDPKVAERAVTLAGFGCTQEEAERAVGVHARHEAYKAGASRQGKSSPSQPS